MNSQQMVSNFDLRASVIIPTFNQKDAVYLTLHSFNHQTDLSNFEVIVVDDGSVDGTAKTVREFQANYPLNYLYQNNQGRAAARNKGIMEAKNEVIIFNDCDRAVSNNFVKRHLDAHIAFLDQLIIGDIKEFYFSNLPAITPRLIESFSNDLETFSKFARQPIYPRTVFTMFDQFGETDYAMPWISFFSGNSSIKLSILNKSGYFDENFKEWGFEHFELGYRLWKLGCKYHYLKSAPNYHFAHPRPNKFYEKAISTSYDYFKTKYQGEQPIILFKDYLSGTLSLQDYHNKLVTTPESFKTNQNQIYYPSPVKFE